ncbi:MAG: hypothetical protein ABDK94_10700 [Atribacterota bacterium]
MESHSAVLKSSVVVVSNEYALNRVKTFVILKETVRSGEYMAKEIKHYVAQHLTTWSIPTEVIFVDQLSLTCMGKVDYECLKNKVVLWFEKADPG